MQQKVPARDDAAFPVAEEPMGVAAEERTEGVHDDVIHLAPAQGIAVLQIFDPCGEAKRSNNGEERGKSPLSQYEGQGQPQGDKQEHVHQHRAVQFRLDLRLAEAVKGNQNRFAGALPSCVDGHIEDHSRNSRKHCQISQPPAQSAALPVAQIAPEEDQQEHPEEDAVEGLAVDK